MPTKQELMKQLEIAEYKEKEFVSFIIGLNLWDIFHKNATRDDNTPMKIDIKEVKEAEEKVSRMRKLLTEDIESFNDQYGNEVFKLNYSYGYSCNDSLQFETSVNGYHGARSTIASELAVALLPRDAKDNIMQIVSDLADKFIVDIN